MHHDDHRHKHHHLLTFLTTLLMFCVVVGMLIIVAHSCGPKSEKAKAADPAPPPPPAVTCTDGGAQGSFKKVPCPDGQSGDVSQVCQKNETDAGASWIALFDTCAANPPPPPPPNPPPPPPPPRKPCDQVTTFDELAPVIALNCVSCHAGRDTYAQAKAESVKPDSMVDRIELEADDAKHMPAGRPKLSPQDRALFKSWVSDGFLAAGECIGSTPPPPTFHDLAWTEGVMLQDILKLPAVDQPNARYLIATDLVNLGRPDLVAVAKAAGSKALNSVSTERGLYPLIDVAPGIWRIDIDKVGIQEPEWQVIEDASQFNLESFTQAGVALKSIINPGKGPGAKLSRLPWMFVDDFDDTVLRNASVYYRVTESPATLPELLAKLDVKFAADLATFKAALIGFKGSTLALAATRLISRHVSRDGVFYASYDTGPVVSNDQTLAAPLLVEAGGKSNFRFAAGEQLYSLPNGLIGSFLADATGKRLDFADPNIVHDFTSNHVAPFIRNAISCSRCHVGGYIHATDEVRGSLANSGILVDDIPKAKALYKPQGIIDGYFADDNSRFALAMAELGIDIHQPDPISRMSDIFLGDWKLDQLGYRFGLRPEEMEECINASPAGKVATSQVLAGGTVAHDQLVLVVAALKADCRLFQDPL